MVVMIVNIDLSQEIFAIDMSRGYVEGFKILFEASSQAYSATLTTIWRPGFKQQNHNALIQLDIGEQ